VHKSPKGAAELAQQVRKIEVFLKKRLFVQKSPKGAAGLAQQVRKIEVFLEKTICAKVALGCSRTSTTKCEKSKSSSKRLSVQKSPKGAAGPSTTSAKNRSLPQKDYTKLSAQRPTTCASDRHNKYTRPSAQCLRERSRMCEGAQPHHTSHYICTARASHLTSVQPSE
jgi:hypothetical protein